MLLLGHFGTGWAAKEGGKARWMGCARSFDRTVCQGIRALVDGTSPAVHLSLRAKIELAALVEELAISPLDVKA
jgi:ATP-dependent helicase Lhr and Lhr-like helicase